MFDLTYERATGPSTGPQPGTVLLQNHIIKLWPRTWSKGIFNPRVIRGTENRNPPRWSIHAEGRAVDIGVSLAASGEIVGDEIANWLTRYAEALGIQYFIWNRQSWSASRGWTAYGGGAGAHRDHLHIEQTRLAAATLTESMLPEATPTPPAIPLGDVTTPGVINDPPWIFEPIRSVLKVRDGVVFMSLDGDIYCPTSPYYGGPNDEILGREFEMLGSPSHLIPHPVRANGYVVVTDLQYSYGYPS